MARNGQISPVPEVPQCQNWLGTCVAFINMCKMDYLDHQLWLAAVESTSSRIQSQPSESTSAAKAVIPSPVGMPSWHCAAKLWPVRHTGTHAWPSGTQHPTVSHAQAHAALESASQLGIEPCICPNWKYHLWAVWVNAGDLWVFVVCSSPVQLPQSWPVLHGESSKRLATPRNTIMTSVVNMHAYA